MEKIVFKSKVLHSLPYLRKKDLFPMVETSSSLAIKLFQFGIDKNIKFNHLDLNGKCDDHESWYALLESLDG